MLALRRQVDGAAAHQKDSNQHNKNDWAELLRRGVASLPSDRTQQVMRKESLQLRPDPHLGTSFPNASWREYGPKYASRVPSIFAGMTMCTDLANP